MDWGWIAAGITVGAVVALLIPRLVPRTPQKATGATLDEDELTRRYKLLTADVNDALEKMERLHDRIRKRAKVIDEPEPGGAVNGFRTGADVYSHAKQRGLIR